MATPRVLIPVRGGGLQFIDLPAHFAQQFPALVPPSPPAARGYGDSQEDELRGEEEEEQAVEEEGEGGASAAAAAAAAAAMPAVDCVAKQRSRWRRPCSGLARQARPIRPSSGACATWPAHWRNSGRV